MQTKEIMRTKSFVIFASLAALLTASCRKEEQGDPASRTPNAGHSANFTSLFAQRVADARQQFAVDAALGGAVTGNQGTSLVFSPGAFRTPAGTIASGQVSVELVEVLDHRAMLRLNKPTVAMRNGSPTLLRSGGQVRVRASQGGQSLTITPNTLIVRVPADTIDAQMDVFYGDEQADGTVAWVEAVDEWITTDSSGMGSSPYYYEFAANSLGWINCDCFPIDWTTSIRIILPQEHTSMNTIAWIVVPAMNGVMHTWAQDMTIVSGRIPIGESAVVVALHETAHGGYESSFTPIAITQGMNVAISFQPTTLVQFDAAINGL
ncbi:MAG TPA: hypothetical protein PKY96_12820 [Flavobacteriales bacterium]|nr:hypothetical protein [Flavobacteriales bacterium]